MSESSTSFTLEEVSFEALKGWQDDDPSGLFAVMEHCCRYITEVKPYRTGSLGLTSDDLLSLRAAIADAKHVSASEARVFFEQNFRPFLVRRADGKRGFVTAFYEPEVAVSDEPDEEYRFPFYRRPDDLVDVDDANRPATLDASYAFAQLSGGAIGPYPDRKAIDQGALHGKLLEIAWAKSKADVFFTHVQGSARLRHRDGRRGRITYAAKAGHPFSAIGKLLIERGEIEPSQISMQSIRAWLAAHPGQMDEVLWHNRSYIFFREVPFGDANEGPIAAAKVPLVAGRSLAVDRNIHTFGFPFFIRSESLRHLGGGKSFGRLMLALDTGSAIVGPARGDIFTGSGDIAGELAGTVRHDADFFILIPANAAARFV
ncbi:transglycosylase [Rhizobium sp. Root708]|uniref:murein transglycosylase A n=1 Tax=Rhizobium sp. Root708 TaxID=1736592 RepID=UPI0006F205C2|nr:murein transglycosylase A [Rhizobium sp. Root708]KRB62974.1 transglycosylase [Rhizobium sp. Root708]